MLDRYVVTSLLIGLVVIYFSWGFIKEYKQNERFEQGVVAFENEDYQNAFKDIMPHAMRGNVDARFYIGTMHALGLGRPAEKGLAVHWFTCKTIKNCTNGQHEFKLAKGCFEEKWGKYGNSVCMQWMKMSGRMEYQPALSWLDEYLIKKQQEEKNINAVKSKTENENPEGKEGQKAGKEDKTTVHPSPEVNNSAQETQKTPSNSGEATPDQPQSDTSDHKS